MTEQPAKPRSKRMVVWLVIVPIALLLLTFAGANWKVYHLAYAKHLMRNQDYEQQARGVQMVLYTHLHEGMPLSEVRKFLDPIRLDATNEGEHGPCFTVHGQWLLQFDQKERLVIPLMADSQGPAPLQKVR